MRVSLWPGLMLSSANRPVFAKLFWQVRSQTWVLEPYLSHVPSVASKAPSIYGSVGSLECTYIHTCMHHACHSRNAQCDGPFLPFSEEKYKSTLVHRPVLTDETGRIQYAPRYLSVAGLPRRESPRPGRMVGERRTPPCQNYTGQNSAQLRRKPLLLKERVFFTQIKKRSVCSRACVCGRNISEEEFSKWETMPIVFATLVKIRTCYGSPGPAGATFGGLHEHRHARVNDDRLPAEIVSARQVF